MNLKILKYTRSYLVDTDVPAMVEHAIEALFEDVRDDVTSGEGNFTADVEDAPPEATPQEIEEFLREYEDSEEEDEIIECALCSKQIWFRDSYSPGDDAICAECDTEVTGRLHPPSLDPTTQPSPNDHE